MRILICNYEYPPLGGGGGVVTALLAEELATRHEVTVLTSQSPGLSSESIENSVRVLRAPVFFRRQSATANLPSMLAFIPMGIRMGKRLLKKEQFDIINTHFALPSGPVGDSLSRHAGIPNVLSVHGGDLFDPSKFNSPHRHRLLRSWIRKLALKADRVIGQSRNTLDNLHEYYTDDVEGIRIPLGIRRPDYVPAPRSKFGFTEEDILLATVGRLVGRKAVDRLIESVRALDNDRVHLIVIGSGPLSESLKKEARKLGIEDKIHLMGFVEEEEKLQLLEMSDLYVSTSQHEGFGLVFLEGMHCGLPVVCYDRGGQIDFLTDGETGHVVELDNLELFTKRCRDLIESPERRKEMGEHNREAVKDFYIDLIAKRYEAVFEEVVASRSSAVMAGVSG